MSCDLVELNIYYNDLMGYHRYIQELQDLPLWNLEKITSMIRPPKIPKIPDGCEEFLHSTPEELLAYITDKSNSNKITIKTISSRDIDNLDNEIKSIDKKIKTLDGRSRVYLERERNRLEKDLRDLNKQYSSPRGVTYGRYGGKRRTKRARKNKSMKR
jgi:hypothetical protein